MKGSTSCQKFTTKRYSDILFIILTYKTLIYTHKLIYMQEFTSTFTADPDELIKKACCYEEQAKITTTSTH